MTLIRIIVWNELINAVFNVFLKWFYWDLSAWKIKVTSFSWFHPDTCWSKRWSNEMIVKSSQRILFSQVWQHCFDVLKSWPSSVARQLLCLAGARVVSEPRVEFALISPSYDPRSDQWSEIAMTTFNFSGFGQPAATQPQPAFGATKYDLLFNFQAIGSFFLARLKFH